MFSVAYSAFVLLSVVTVVNTQTIYTVEDIIGRRCGPAQACYPISDRINQLGASMTGYIIRRTDTEYTAENLMYNQMEQRSTKLIAMVRSKEDIRKAVLFAQEFNLHVTIKSTGHDYVGRSTWNDSFVIHLDKMKNIDVNPQRTSRSQYGELKTETGTNWKTIYQTLHTYNRTIVGGSAHTVGPGGYTLGGGHSPISKSLGYAVDNVLEMQVVLADGSFATCTESQTVIEHVNGTIETRNDGDLFWALRGGGGGTFGVIVFKIHPQPSGMVVFSGSFPLIFETSNNDALDDVMSALQTFIRTAPNHWGGYWMLNNRPFDYANLKFRGLLTLYFNKFSSWDNTEENDMKDFLALRDKYSLTDITFVNKTSFWDYEKDVYDPPTSNVYLVTSLLDKEGARSRLADFIRQEFLKNWRDDTVGCTGILVGGKTTEPSIDSTPLNPGYRSAVSVMSCGVDFAGARPSTKDSLLQRSKAFALRIRSLGEGMYFNEPSKDSLYWREDYWGKKHYARLVEIKKRYDADNFFTCYHCVNSDNSPYVSDDGSSGSARVSLHVLSLALVLFYM